MKTALALFIAESSPFWTAGVLFAAVVVLSAGAWVVTTILEPKRWKELAEEWAMKAVIRGLILSGIAFVLLSIGQCRN